MSLIALTIVSALAAVPDDGGATYPDPVQEFIPSVPMGIAQTCTDSGLNAVAALPFEDGHYNATRIESATPYRLDKLSYQLWEGPWSWVDGSSTTCGPLAHDLVLFKGTVGDPPPANPVELLRVPMTSSVSSSVYPPNGKSIHIFEVVPSSTIDVYPGEELWMAVEMKRPSEASGICQVLCLQGEAADSDTWWSNAATPAYSWDPLKWWGYYEDGTYFAEIRR